MFSISNTYYRNPCHHYCCLFLAPNWISMWASPVLLWCFYSKLIILLGPFAAYFMRIYSSYFFFIFSILFLPGPCPWNLADKYLNAYLGFISLPLAFLYSILTLSPGWLWWLSLSLFLPNCYSLPSKFFSLKNYNVPASPYPIYFCCKKLTSYFIFSSSCGDKSLKSNTYFYYFFTTIFSDGKLTNKHEVVPFAASAILYTFFASSAGFDIL